MSTSWVFLKDTQSSHQISLDLAYILPAACPSCFFPSYGVAPSPVSNNVSLILQDQVRMVSLPGSCSGLLFILSLLWSSISPPHTFLMHIILCLAFFVYLAAVAKSSQSCPTLCNPIDGSPPGSSIPGILQARTLEWVAISFFSAWKWKVKVKSLSRVRLLATPRTVAHQAPPSMGFSRQEDWSGVPLPSPTCILTIL